MVDNYTASGVGLYGCGGKAVLCKNVHTVLNLLEYIQRIHLHPKTADEVFTNS